MINKNRTTSNAPVIVISYFLASLALLILFLILLSSEFIASFIFLLFLSCLCTFNLNHTIFDLTHANFILTNANFI